jgi:protein-S-isoprenylcysteine O-methyltransferase Ste14
MNTFYPSLIPALWLAWIVYWAIAARDAKTTQRVESPASRASHIVPLIIAGWLLGTRSALGGFLAGQIVSPGTATDAVAVLLVAAGLAFAVWARVCLGRNWSGVVTLKQDHELVRSGPYRFVRHPIYTGLLIAFLGSALARNEWRALLAVALVWLAFWRKLKIEEGWMIEQFGDAYVRYRAEVPALIPNPFRHSGAPGA